MHTLTFTPLQAISFLLYPTLFFGSFLLFSFYSWKKQHHVLAAISFSSALFASRYYMPLTNWLKQLGSDSFEEAQNFDPVEAISFLQALSNNLIPTQWKLVLIGLAITLCFVLLLLVIAYLALKLCKSQHYFPQAVLWLSLLCFSIPIHHHYTQISQTFVSNSQTFKNIKDNYTNKEDLLNYRQIHQEPLQVIVYIGESTARLHWGLFGYPIETTPKIQQFQKENTGLLSFSNVSSTHTHTSRSLLDALSFRVEHNLFQQSVDAKRASLPSVLNALNISTNLLSTQSQSGTANYASTVIFSATKDRHFAEKYSYLLGGTNGDNSVFDHEHFFSESDFLNTKHPLPAVTFLHSYAGHARYLSNIPSQFHYTSDPFFHNSEHELIAGSKVVFDVRQATQAYDSAMRYIDSNLAYLFEQVKAKEQPTVVVYFADHGESVETGKGHDIAAYQIEMSQIPFLMYFNQAAQQAIPDIFQAFKQASIADRPSTLAQLSPTILRILGYEATSEGQTLTGIGLDSEEMLPPIAVRFVNEGLSYIRSHNKLLSTPKGAIDSTDNANKIWLSRKKRFKHENDPLLCYNEANSFAKAIRGGLTADCLAISLAIDEHNSLYVLPDNAYSEQANQWLLQAIAKTAQSYRASLWLNINTIEPELACSAIASLSNQPPDIVIQLAAPNAWPNSCQQLAEQGFRFAIDLPNSFEAQDILAWYQHLLSFMPPFLLVSDAERYFSLVDSLDADWALLDINANQLPWQNQPSYKKPNILLINTQWDINSR